MCKTVADLITQCEGVDAISAASQSGPDPVSASAVHKWRRNGIPDEHWWIFTKSGVTVEELYQANEAAREARRESEPKQPQEEDQEAA